MAGASRFLGILSVCGAFRIVIRHARSHVELLQAVLCTEYMRCQVNQWSGSLFQGRRGEDHLLLPRSGL